MSKFTLEIELGNDTMQTPFDVSRTLLEVASRLNRDCGGEWHLDAGRIPDANGNTVGSWDLYESDVRVEVGD